MMMNVSMFHHLLGSFNILICLSYRHSTIPMLSKYVVFSQTCSDSNRENYLLLRLIAFPYLQSPQINIQLFLQLLFLIVAQIFFLAMPLRKATVCFIFCYFKIYMGCSIVDRLFVCLNVLCFICYFCTSFFTQDCLCDNYS